jgi:hypothetical protein
LVQNLTPNMHLHRAAFVLWSQAARSLLRHKARSSLTSTGIAIGIAAVVWVVAIGSAGAERAEAPVCPHGPTVARSAVDRGRKCA